MSKNKVALPNLIDPVLTINVQLTNGVCYELSSNYFSCQRFFIPYKAIHMQKIKGSNDYLYKERYVIDGDVSKHSPHG